jgi:hypothetical protein
VEYRGAPDLGAVAVHVRERLGASVRRLDDRPAVRGRDVMPAALLLVRQQGVSPASGRPPF